ncbi:MAG: hypothetical protein JWR75_426 [Devosia sp.]|nr:hypothetical protein [Devosia sp.]
MFWTVLSLVILLFAVLSFAVAARQAFVLWRMAPIGHRYRNHLWLGWWRFDLIEEMIGPAARPELEIYKRAFVAFILLIVAGLVVGFAATSFSR